MRRLMLLHILQMETYFVSALVGKNYFVFHLNEPDIPSAILQYILGYNHARSELSIFQLKQQRL